MKFLTPVSLCPGSIIFIYEAEETEGIWVKINSQQSNIRTFILTIGKEFSLFHSLKLPK